MIPNIDAFEERAAIMEYDGGLSRSIAEDRAAQKRDLRDADHLREVPADNLLAGSPERRNHD